MYDIGAEKTETSIMCNDFESLNSIEPNCKDGNLLYFCGPTNEDNGGVAVWDIRASEDTGITKFAYKPRLPHDVKCSIKGNEIAVCDENGGLFVAIGVTLRSSTSEIQAAT